MVFLLGHFDKGKVQFRFLWLSDVGCGTASMSECTTLSTISLLVLYG